MSTPMPMSLSEARESFDRDGFVVLPRLLGNDDLAGAIADLPAEFPTPHDFHDDVDPQRNRRFRDEFGGIVPFPTRSTAMNLLSVHPRLIQLARHLLDDVDLRSYSIEFWAKYTDAADYEQPFHRDYLNHSILVPSPDAPASQVEMFVYLTDVTDDHGPIALLPRRFAGAVPALPNWYPRVDGHVDRDHPDWVSPRGRADWYELEQRAVGPVGTVVAYRIETLHRGTALRHPGGHRVTIHTNFRRASHDWITRRAWTDCANDEPAWAEFVAAATPEQLQLFGFPPPRHPYWTPATLDGVALRYPGFDPEPWH